MPKRGNRRLVVTDNETGGIVETQFIDLDECQNLLLQPVQQRPRLRLDADRKEPLVRPLDFGPLTATRRVLEPGENLQPQPK